jgi:hypothetical protein
MPVLRQVFWQGDFLQSEKMGWKITFFRTERFFAENPMILISYLFVLPSDVAIFSKLRVSSTGLRTDKMAILFLDMVAR